MLLALRAKPGTPSQELLLMAARGEGIRSLWKWAPEWLLTLQRMVLHPCAYIQH